MIMLRQGIIYLHTEFHLNLLRFSSVKKVQIYTDTHEQPNFLQTFAFVIISNF